MAISDTWLKANLGKERASRLEKSDREGLSARVTTKGKIIFQMRYRYYSKPARLDIGSYPLLSLKEARLEHARLKKELEAGHDPRVIRAKEKQTIAQAQSLSTMFYDWYEAYCVKNKKNHHEIKRSFELHVLPKVGKLPAGEITIHQWLAILEELAKNRAGIADRILTNVKQLLKWGFKRELLERNVLSDINAKEDLQIRKGVGTRSLSREEIKRVWEAADQSRMSPKNKIYLKLCLIYGCRNGELRLSEKSHFDIDSGVWLIPPNNHKLGKSTGKPLLRPITKGIEPYLREALRLSGKGKFVFNNEGTSMPMGQSAPLALPYNIMQWLRKNKSFEMKHWSIHDLRKTARTNFSTLTDPHIAELMLGHKLPGSWQVYDHYDYLAEQTIAYEKWVARLEEFTA